VNPPAERIATRIAPTPGAVTATDAAAEALAATALFGSLQPPVLRQLATLCGRRHYSRGEFLFHCGDGGDGLLVVVRGLVKVVVSSSDGVEMLLTTMGAGDTLGELSLLDGAPRSASVVAAEPTTVLRLGRRELLDMMARHPAVLDEILTTMGGIVRRLTETSSDLVFLDLGARLAKALLRLAASHGRPGASPGNLVLDVGLTQSDIAAMVGATRQAANRALHQLAAQGWIGVDGQVIVVRDLEGLRRRADGFGPGGLLSSR